jgi:hypothetical protein
MTEALIVLTMAVVWWVPTFMGLADLQRRTRIRRVLVWKWTAILCVPVVGAWLYSRRGKDELAADERSRPGPAR